MTLSAVLSAMNITDKQDVNFAISWAKSRFNNAHMGLFAGYPLYNYNSTSKVFELIEE